MPGLPLYVRAVPLTLVGGVVMVPVPTFAKVEAGIVVTCLTIVGLAVVRTVATFFLSLLDAQMPIMAPTTARMTTTTAPMVSILRRRSFLRCCSRRAADRARAFGRLRPGLAGVGCHGSPDILSSEVLFSAPGSTPATGAILAHVAENARLGRPDTACSTILIAADVPAGAYIDLTPVSNRRSRMATRDEICAVCDQYIALLSKGDADAIVELYDPGARVEDPLGTRPKMVMRRFAGSTRESSGVSLTATDSGPVTVVGHEAAFQFRVDVPVGDDTISMVTTDLMTFNEAGKVVSMKAYADMDAKPGT